MNEWLTYKHFGIVSYQKHHSILPALHLTNLSWNLSWTSAYVFTHIIYYSVLLYDLCSEAISYWYLCGVLLLNMMHLQNYCVLVRALIAEIKHKLVGGRVYLAYICWTLRDHWRMSRQELGQRRWRTLLTKLLLAPGSSFFLISLSIRWCW